MKRFLTLIILLFFFATNAVTVVQADTELSSGQSSFLNSLVKRVSSTVSKVVTNIKTGVATVQQNVGVTILPGPTLNKNPSPGIGVTPIDKVKVSVPKSDSNIVSKARRFT